MNPQITMSISGSMILLFYFLLSFIYKNKAGFRWHMICLKIALFFYLIPIGSLKYLLIPYSIWPLFDNVNEDFFMNFNSDMISIPTWGGLYLNFSKPVFVITLVWLLFAGLYITYQLFHYFYFRRNLLKTSEQLGSYEAETALEKFPKLKNMYRKRKVTVYRNINVEGPFTCGIFSPCIILPPVKFTPRYA